MEVSLEGKVALVTGVGPNIGSGVALALAKYGAKVACNDVSKESIDACMARIELGGQVNSVSRKCCIAAAETHPNSIRCRMVTEKRGYQRTAHR